MNQNEQYKEITIPNGKSGSSKDKVEKIFSKIYNYIFKKIQTEKIVKNSLIVEQAKFLGYLGDEDANNPVDIEGNAIEAVTTYDNSIAQIQLYSDLSFQKLNAFIINPTIEYNPGQTVLVGYWGTIQNLFILGPIEKKGVITDATN